MFSQIFGAGNRKSIGKVLAQYRGVGPGFDLLRILLSFYIFYGHTLWISGLSMSSGALANQVLQTVAGQPGPTASFDGWTRPMHVAVLPLFFALSGFLVMGSAFRLRATSTFLANRFLRIFPALIVEVTLCAVLLGATLTTLPQGEYFSDPRFARYICNILGFVTFELPSLFGQNPVPNTVNLNLWTLPSEFRCYFITALLMSTGLIYRRMLFTVAFVVVTLAGVAANIVADFAVVPGVLPPSIITYYFFAGVMFFHWQHRIPARLWMFVACGVISYALLMSRHTVFIVPLTLTYCMVFFGLINIPRLPIIRTGDYSYGVYLYGFPIAQALVAAFPTVFVGHRWLLLLCATVLTFAFAAFSWHVVEKRVLPMKRHLPQRWFPVPARRASSAPAQ